MSHVADSILPKLEKLVLTAFEDAKVFQRAEMKEDEEPGDDLLVYLNPMDPVTEDSPFHMDHRTYPVEMVLKFNMTGHGLRDDEDDQHAVQEQKQEYVDAVFSLVKQFEYEGTQVYQSTITETNLKYEPENVEIKDHEHRIRFVWQFRTVEVFA